MIGFKVDGLAAGIEQQFRRTAVMDYISLVLIWIVLVPLELGATLLTLGDFQLITGLIAGLVTIAAWFCVLLGTAFLALRSMHWERVIFGLSGLLAAVLLGVEAAHLVGHSQSLPTNQVYVATAISLALTSGAIVYGRSIDSDLLSMSSWRGSRWLVHSIVAMPLIFGTVPLLLYAQLHEVGQASLAITAAWGIAWVVWHDVSGLRAAARPTAGS